ncbi:hypothetical protein BDN70DRAFT_876275 [Pholiota conissans]|uniref:Uncharacterized protein n=1 Tax=Pholiota conissans TaxID=109636 RepID=A0A9P5Z7A1_9AGAR|nr:hypothetical protein BDN70DRAFT_876275 [Pholiota conissans]
MKNFFAKTFHIILAALVTLPTLAWSVSVPNADTPVFYLVSSSTSSSNLLPVRMSSTGNGYASLTGTGVPAQFYFYQGRLTIYDPNNNSLPYFPLINSFQNDVASCDTFGALVFVQGGSSNKCAKSSSFQIQSNGQNSQLGAELVFNYVGGFYSCSNGQEVFYKLNPSDGPTGCDRIHLWTVPTA